ncbi:MAG: hypothetical protein WAO57_13035 [Syntrophomonadaceae bacterium]
MYIRVITRDGERVVVAKDALGVFAELKSFAFVPPAMTVEDYMKEMAHSVWTFYGKGVQITGDTLAQRAQNAYRKFVDLGFLVEISKEDALRHFGLSQAEADKKDIAGLRSGD